MNDIDDKVYCRTCRETPSRIYKHNDKTTGQSIDCDHKDFTYEVMRDQISEILWEIDHGPVDIADEVTDGDHKRIQKLQAIVQIAKRHR